MPRQALLSSLVCALAFASTAACDVEGTEAELADSTESELSTGVPWVSAESVSSLVYENPEQPVLSAEPALERRFGRELSPPYAQTAEGAQLKPWDYLRRLSALGHAGPVGSFGPLGSAGPVGGSATSPDTSISGLFAWSSWARFFTAMGGPLSALGPLGRDGPANPIFWEELPQRLATYWRDRPDVVRAFTNDFLVHLRPGGIFGVVGPTGPLGAFGPLGPLGPVGAHGYVRANGGEYHPNAFDVCHDVDGDRRAPPCRTVDVPWAAGDRRTYELFESYTEEKAKALNDESGARANDTSFLVRGSIAAPNAEVDQYVFHSRSTQWVIITLIPESAKYKMHQLVNGNGGCDKTLLSAASDGNFEAPDGMDVLLPDAESSFKPCARSQYQHRASYDDFDLDLTIEDPSGKSTRVASHSRDMVDWVEVLVPAGTTLVAKVALERAWQPTEADAAVGIRERTSTPSYRLIVVGSSPHFVLNTRFTGPFSKRALFR